MTPGIIAIENLYKSYPMGETRLPVLNGLNFELEAGQLVAIMGRSGSGKSTLLNVIAGLEEIDSGKIYFAGTDIGNLKSRQRVIFRRDNLGIIYQFFNLVPTLTVEENITLPFLIAGEKHTTINGRLEHVLQYTGMASRRKHLPSQLSGGEMQLVSLARAFIRQPKVILADEPTGNVNLKTGKMIMQKLRTTAEIEETSIVLVTHSPEDASWADRIDFLVDGKIKSDASLRKGKTHATHIYNRLKELGI
ncbi:ABC transporter ATP-binding protein [candidate division KSB1 bacterium]|nr:ABC transporter ATP-binding protein [candidate division KSB1 bacterium]